MIKLVNKFKGVSFWLDHKVGSDREDGDMENVG